MAPHVHKHLCVWPFNHFHVPFGNTPSLRQFQTGTTHRSETRERKMSMQNWGESNHAPEPCRNGSPSGPRLQSVAWSWRCLIASWSAVGSAASSGSVQKDKSTTCRAVVSFSK